MENDKLSQIWNSQRKDVPLAAPERIIEKAKKQREGQIITIAVLSVTAVILIVYAIRYAGRNWNDFTLGLTLMITSLTCRTILEYWTIYQKKNRLIGLDNPSFQRYLKKYYRRRLRINYLITPICFGLYVWGFAKLLPYFKSAFSKGFYTYILISGIASLIVLAVIIINSVIKEQRFLKQLNE